MKILKNIKELVEPKKPIVYYVDTTQKWRKYLKQGLKIGKHFEAAGFKNAIISKRPSIKEGSIGARRY